MLPGFPLPYKNKLIIPLTINFDGPEYGQRGNINGKL